MGYVIAQVRANTDIVGMKLDLRVCYRTEGIFLGVEHVVSIVLLLDVS